ncbi:hypothetical protein M0R45_012482 [Rubus argutus]|uniref:Transmembrane protein n=1 Tax=Rubus argutus TaxID=59490 RepID=A0AAW1YCU0_RUBAR
MDSLQVFDSVKAEKANAMRRYRWRHNLRSLFKACLPLAPLFYAISGYAPRQLLAAVFHSNLEPDLYGEYVANVDSRRSDLAAESTPEPEDLVKDKEIGCCDTRRSIAASGYEPAAFTETTPLPEEVSTESYDQNVNVESVPLGEGEAVTETELVVHPISSSCVEESEKVKRYRRTQSESFDKTRKPKRDLQRSDTDMHRKTGQEPARRSSVEELTDEEFQRQIEFFITSKKLIQMQELRKDQIL